MPRHVGSLLVAGCLANRTACPAVPVRTRIGRRFPAAGTNQDAARLVFIRSYAVSSGFDNDSGPPSAAARWPPSRDLPRGYAPRHVFWRGCRDRAQEGSTGCISSCYSFVERWSDRVEPDVTPRAAHRADRRVLRVAPGDNSRAPRSSRRWRRRSRTSRGRSVRRPRAGSPGHA